MVEHPRGPREWNFATIAKGNDLIEHRCFAPCERLADSFGTRSVEHLPTTRSNLRSKLCVHSIFHI